MKTKKLQLWFALLLILTLNSCGDDDNNDNNNNSGGDTDIVGEAGIMQNINTTNLSTYAFPWYFQDMKDLEIYTKREYIFMSHLFLKIKKIF